MKIAVIGAGRMGSIRVEDLTPDPRVSEVIVTNRTAATATELAERFGASTVPWDERTEIDADAFVVTSATDQHVEQLEALIPLGKPILLEKPISLTLADDDHIINLAEEFRTQLQIAFQRRFDAGMRGVYELSSSGDLGTLYALNIVAHDHIGPTREYAGGNGGIFRDLHVHDFDLARWLTGSEIETVYATKAVRSIDFLAEFDDADVTLIHMMSANGVQISVSGTRHDAVGHDVRLEMFGSADSVTAGVNSRTPLHPQDGGLVFCNPPYTGFVDRFREAFRAETAAFVSLVGGEIENPSPPEGAREALRIAIACEESVKTGRPIRVADMMSE